MTKSFKEIIEATVASLMKQDAHYKADEFIDRKTLAKRWHIGLDKVRTFHNRDIYGKDTIVYHQFGNKTTYMWRDCLEFAEKNFRMRD